MNENKESLITHLETLGLSHDEAKCYLLIVEYGSLSAVDLAKRIQTFPNAVYRLAKKLEEKEFIVVLDTRPKTFQAIPVDIALEGYVKRQEQLLEKLKVKVTEQLVRNNTKSETKVDVLAGRKKTYEAFIELGEKTKEELLVISIGEPVSDDIKIATRNALERGVAVKLLFHVYNKQNEELLKSWVKMGCEVRHYSDTGYHLMVFDRKKSILVSNNPSNTEERTGVVIYSEGLSHALRNYFFTLWDKAIVIH